MPAACGKRLASVLRCRRMESGWLTCEDDAGRLLTLAPMPDRLPAYDRGRMIPHEEIRSAANPRVRQASLLRDANARRETGLTLIDGRRELATAVAKGVAIVELFLDAEMLRASSLPASDPLKEQAFVEWLQALVARGTQILALSRKAFERIAFGGRNEGCVGVARYSCRRRLTN